MIRRCTLATCAALVLGAVPAVAAPAWGPVVNLSKRADWTNISDVAVGDQGQVVVLWQRGLDSRAHLYLSARRASGAWSPRVRVPGSLGTGGAVADFDHAGTLVLVWAAGRQVMTVRRSADGSWTKTQRLATTPSGSANGTYPGYLTLDVNRQGRAVAAWETVDDDADSVYALSRVQVVTSNAHGVWGPVRTLSGQREAFRPDVGIDRRGRATVVWSEVVRLRASRIMTASRPPRGSWSSARALSDPGTNPFAPTLAVTGAGRLAVAWAYRSPTRHGVSVRRWSYPGGWQPSVRAPVAPRAARSAWIDLGIDAAGTVTLLWTPGWEGAVRTADQAFDGRWGVVRQLGRPGGFSYGLTLEVDAAGDAVAGWQSLRGGDHPVLGAYRPREGSWLRTVPLSDVRGDSFGPELGLTPQGDAVAAWAHMRNATPERGRIQTRFLPADDVHGRHVP